MKKILIAIFLMMGLTPLVCNAGMLFPLLSFNVAISGDDFGDDGDSSGPRNTICSPSVAIDEHTLYLYDGCDNTTLRLVSSDETVAFSTFITTGTTSVVLPSTLSGEYRLEIVKGNITFYCYIDL